ncbi:D-serine ammonia-lyase [Thermoflavimicrobium daqui]|uniref:Probable D-serine dehydratase n=1 Tax=Thermoflavimicrobium daqui TaxID=2137476 RepID=A0A364K4I7_9BACL|nr:D-serine ammonia-lyase [Thermoflavimicrobium daqui]RAL24256.1 D-serine ammonia-lyase [Thermoflavimicrobium daqui]
MIQGKTVEEWITDFPLLSSLIETEEVFWMNSKFGQFRTDQLPVGEQEITDASERWKRFAPYLMKAFPETKEMNGIIESPLVPIPRMKKYLEQTYKQNIPGSFLLKCDSHLPIAGSIKARGGIYEVLKYAEDLAITHGLITTQHDYEVLDSQEFRNFFNQYSIAVGSTGNLGLSIGMVSAKIGFQVTIHMSADAKEWKKELLRSKGVHVIEYTSDYSKAVEEGRKQALADPNCYFIDDENSLDLFLGYAVAAARLKKQLEELRVKVDQNHPLFVYLPCGVGGAPGGIAFGLKQIYQDHVHCFFAEPTHSPCMLLGLLTGLHDQIAVQDFGIDNRTEADGLAVGRPSRFVGKVMEGLLSGIYTIEDDRLFVLLSALIEHEQISLEPSALAGMVGAIQLATTETGQEYLTKHQLKDKWERATHVVWATGGKLVPRNIMNEYYEKGLWLAKNDLK